MKATHDWASSLWLKFQCSFVIMHLWIEASRFQFREGKKTNKNEKMPMQQMWNGISLKRITKLTELLFLFKFRFCCSVRDSVDIRERSVFWLACETHFDDILSRFRQKNKKKCSHKILHSLHDWEFDISMLKIHNDELNYLKALIFLFALLICFDLTRLFLFDGNANKGLQQVDKNALKIVDKTWISMIL